MIFKEDLKKRSKGLPIVTVPLILFSDDSSGNRSKKWNKFDNWAMLLGGLPRSENAKTENIHLIAASNQVPAVGMCNSIVNDLNMLEEEGVFMYDASLKQECLVIAPVICFLCDNVRASELVNHMGSSANKYCRMCQVSNFHNINFILT